MRQQFKKVIILIVLMSACGSILWAIYWIISNAYIYISSLQKEVVAALIAGSSTVIVSTITVVLAKHYESKRERDALYREKKVEIYDEFIKGLFTHFFSGENKNDPEEGQNLVIFFRDFIRKLLLWGDPDTINKYIEWKEYLTSNKPNARTVLLTEELILAIRKDLHKNNKGIKKWFYASFILNDPSLFLVLVNKNPTITLEQVAQFEVMHKILLKEQEIANTQTAPVTSPSANDAS